jgi:type II secretory pathway component PulF
MQTAVADVRNAMNRLVFRTVRATLFWKPIRRHEQMLFAEALSQALSAGIEISTAIIVALEANPSYRFRLALREMGKYCRSGYPLERALTKTGVGVGGQLLAALRIGEENGKLAEMLMAYARASCANPVAKLAEALRRPAKVNSLPSCWPNS